MSYKAVQFLLTPKRNEVKVSISGYKNVSLTDKDDIYIQYELE